MFRYPICDEHQLFVDDLLVAETQHLVKVLHQPVKHDRNPVLRGEHPAENDFACLHGAVLRDPADGLFKAWYLTAAGVGYAVSEDGLTWRKPVTGVFSGADIPPNTVYRGVHPRKFAAGAWKVDGCSVMVDPRDTPERRYKMFLFECSPSPEAHRADPYGVYGYFTATSPDGIHWRARRRPVISRREDPEMSDAMTCSLDAATGRFTAFTKKHRFCPNGLGDQDTMLRVRGISFSTDFRRWTKPALCLLPDDHDPRDVNLYRMSGWRYESLWLGELEIYYSDYRRRERPLTRDIQFISSRDGEQWWRAGGRRTYLPCGTDGDWDSHMLDSNSAGPIRVGDELWIYYGGRSYPHDRHPQFFPGVWKRAAGIGLAKLRPDGFISYDAGDEPGVLLTKPLRFAKGRRLRLNADARHGSIRVEVLPVIERPDVPEQNQVWRWGCGEPVADYRLEDAVPMTADSLGATIAWRNGTDVSRFADVWIALRFHLTRAQLYSFWFDNGQST